MYEKQLADVRDKLEAEKDSAIREKLTKELDKLSEQKKTFDEANRAFKGRKDGYQTGKLGVDLALNSRDLRDQKQLSLTANRQVNGRQVLEIGGVWIDDQFKADTPTLVVKSQSNAYFRILEKQPAMKEVFRLGNHLVWVAPNGTALVIDQNDGKEELADKEIEALFAAKK
jgi:Ca-activated chloride channel family protein